MKYNAIYVVFKEHPKYISLLFEITNCPHRCKNCHTPELQENIGDELDINVFGSYINAYKILVRNVIFFGGNQYKDHFIELLKICHENNLKTTLWTGDDEIDPDIKKHLDYLKTGLYIESKGPLGAPNTNQRYVEVKTGKDIVIK